VQYLADFDGTNALQKTFPQAIAFWHQRRNRGAETLVMFHDYEPFHGKAGQRGAMNFLFADFHVGDIE
jgi:prepilin-type processing-associated H-X9-DG protein